MLRDVVFLLQSGHFLFDRTAVSMQVLQKTWPHEVEHGSRVRTSSRQTGHLYHVSDDLSSSAERARFGGDGLVARDISVDVLRRIRFARAVLVATDPALWRGTMRREVSGEHKSIIASGERSLAVCGWTSKLDRSIISIGSPGGEKKHVYAPVKPTVVGNLLLSAWR